MLRPTARTSVLLALSAGMVGTAQAAPLNPGDYTPLAASLAPTTDLTIDTVSLTITGDASLCGTGTCTGVLDGGVAVFTFDDIDLSAVDVTVTGLAPLALLSTSDIVIGGLVDASAVGVTGGPGGSNGGAAAIDGFGTGGGLQDLTLGGGGGAFGGDGGAGGGAAGGLAYGDLLTLLEGGSGGGGGDDEGGGSGGAIELGATGDIDILLTAIIAADGAAGAGGGVAGGGGGSGGGILIHGATGTIDGIVTASGGGGAASANGGGGGGGGGRIAVSGFDPGAGILLVTQGPGGASGGSAGVAGGVGVVTIDADGDGFDSTIDCDDTNAAYDAFLDWYPDCDGDLEPAGASSYLCDPTDIAGDICFAGVQPASWSLAAGTDCNDQDAAAQANSDFYPDCDNDTAFDSSAVNACGTGGADAATPCVDTNPPDGGWSAVAGADCNDEDPLADALADYYPDCDNDTVFDSTPTNACGVLGAQTAFDCFDGLDPDGGFDTTAGTDCNDEDGTAQANQDFYPDCDGDGVFDSVSVNACGTAGADTVTPCADLLPPDGGWSTSAGNDCDDEDFAATARIDVYPDCDADGEPSSVAVTNVCGLAGANAAFDCVDGLDPDGGFSATAGTDCNDEDAAAQALDAFWPDCDADGVFSATIIPGVCGEAGASAIFDCVDGLDPDGGYATSAGTDCNDEDAAAFQLEDFYPDCDGDSAFASTVLPGLCGLAGASAAFDCVDGLDPDGGFSLTAGTDCNDEDAAAFQLQDFYPDCDGDTVHASAAVPNVCGIAGANLAFDCVDGLDPDGGYDLAVGTDCNDEDAAASALANWYPDCDGDGTHAPAAVNACGVLGAGVAFDCVDGANPDGGFDGTMGADCNDEDAAAQALSDWYPDCDDDGVHSPSPVNACGLLGAAVAFDCVDGANPDGGFDAVLGTDCNDEDASGSVVEPWYPDCDGDGAFDTTPTNACALTGASAAFDCLDGADPDGSFSTLLGTDCDDELAVAQVPENWYPDCDDDGFGDPTPTLACGRRGANAAFDCLDGFNPDGSWSLALGTDCDDEEGTTCPDDVQCPDICGDGVDNDCDTVGDWATPGALGFLDDDADSLDYDAEQLLGTDDCNTDSDGDGIDDDIELTLSTDPTDDDSDGDGLSDGLEVNVLGTNPLDTDTDADQVPDNIEVGDPGDPTDTDGDTVINALDDDDDGDNVLTIDEDWDGSGSPGNDASDTDGIPDYLDDDDDNDGILTIDEVYGANTDPLLENFDAAGGDTLPDFRDPDDDDDGIDTVTELVEATLAGLDIDGNGEPAWRDLDSDGDGWSDTHEDTEGASRDTDTDGTPDYLDLDSDADNVPDALEVGNEALPLSARDTDGDGFEDRIDNDDDGDGRPTINEVYGANTDPLAEDFEPDGIPDFLDNDDDNDGIPTLRERTEGAFDFDDDGSPNWRDLDADDDGWSDAHEDTEGATNDADGNGDPDYLDLDSDQDGVLDEDELGDEALPLSSRDTDDDGLENRIDDDDDGDNVPTTTDGIGDTDNDTIADYLDTDDDGDGLLTVNEVYDGETDPTQQQTDSDGVPDYLDDDDDDDNVPTAAEAAPGQDTDGDNLPDFRDPDDDGDNVPTADEAYQGNSDPQAQFSDADALPDYLDTDDDGDGVPTADEAYDGETDPQAQFTDADALPDYLDTDDDGDNVPTADEGAPNQDTDGNTLPDYRDDDDDGDTVLTLDEDVDGSGTPTDDQTDADGVPDYLDDDDDGDTVPTADEAYTAASPLDEDTDGDLIPDFRDDDDDGDTVLTIDEDLDGDGDLAEHDTDGQAPPDYLDPDDDGDGILTRFEEAAGSNRLSIDSDTDGLRDDVEWLNLLPLDDPALCSDDGCNPGSSNRCEDRDGGRTGLSFDDPWDRDADGLINALDDDDDGDGILTLLEGGDECLGNEPDLLEAHLDFDTDGDGICDELEDPGDTDGDGTPEILDCDEDGCDGDADDDGLPNCVERFLLCPQDADGNCIYGTPQLDPDTDGDGIPDGLEVSDPDCQLPEPGAACQADDTDDDGLLDVYDIDDDGDGFVTNEEIGCEIPSPLGDPDPDDGVDPAAYVASGFDPETLCDGKPYEPRDTDGDEAPDYLDLDDDGDGKNSDIDGEEGGDPEGLGDADGDGVVDYLDPDDFDGPDADADGDGFSNLDETAQGMDPYRVDSDGDGISDPDEVGGDINAPLDSDFDGIIDALDDDDDGDGVLTEDEGSGDPDGDGLPNHLDLDSNGDGEDDSPEGAVTDSDCDGFVDNLDLEPTDGPCGEQPEPYVVERYERQPCSCAASPGAGWLAIGLGLLGLVRRRR